VKQGNCWGYVVLGLFVAGAVHAEAKDPLPDSLSLGGIALYATIDVGYAYQSNGVPLNGTYPGGLEYQTFTTTRNFAGSVSTVTNSGLEQSKIGLRVSQPISGDFTLIGRTETAFNPLTGQIIDACASVATNGGKVQGQQTANADSSRCGQAFNGALWGGVSHPLYGALSIGRHNSLELDALSVYDPQTLSYAFSFLGYSGFDGGAGSTEGARWNNSIKYAYQHGPARLAVMYSNGGQDTGILGKAYGVDLGVTVGGLSLEAVAQNEKGVINLRSSFNDPANPIPTPGLSSFVSDDTSYNFMGKYTFDLQTAKLTAYAGYSHIDRAHADYTVGNAQNNYQIVVPITVNTPAKFDMEWAGLRYALSSGWNFIGAVYHVSQNSWTIGKLPGGTAITNCVGAGLLCAGDFDEGSLVVDYIINKHYDAYVGANWSEVTNGLASGFKGTAATGASGSEGSENSTVVMIGFRIRI
jgi:predicted porin